MSRIEQIDYRRNFCSKCGRAVHDYTRREWDEGTSMLAIQCSRCGYDWLEPGLDAPHGPTPEPVRGYWWRRLVKAT